MIDQLITWLSGLPSLAVYSVVGLLSAVENVFPPVPADTAVVLGAFLAHRGVTTPWLVFAVTMVCNTATAMGMYWLGARHATTLFQTSLARWLLPTDGVAFVEREYQRFGLLGLFLGRLLPGFRAIICPFAGMVHLGFWRTIVPVVAASALWYGGLVYAAAKLGEHWEELMRLVSRLNSGFGIAALIVAILLGVSLWRRRHAARSVT